MKLVIWEDNWADEMYVTNISIVSDEKYQKTIDAINLAPSEFWKQENWNGQEGFSVGIGTNEFVSYPSAKSLLGSLKFFDIDETDAEKINGWIDLRYGGFGTQDIFGRFLEDMYEWRSEQDPPEEEVP